MRCKQSRREHSLSGAVTYKEVIPISDSLSARPPNQPAGAHGGMINSPVRLRYRGHPSPPGISISEQHSCHFCVQMNGWIFKGLKEDVMAAKQRQLTKFHTKALSTQAVPSGWKIMQDCVDIIAVLS